MSDDVRGHRRKRVGKWSGSDVRKHKAHDKTNPIKRVAEHIKSITQRNKDGRPTKWH